MYYTYRNILKLLLPKTLNTRFVLIIIIPILVGQSVAIYLFYKRHWYNVTNHSSRFVVNEIKSLLESREYLSTNNQKEIYLNLKYKFIRNSIIPNFPKEHIEEIRIFRDTLKQAIHKKTSILIEGSTDIILYLQIGHDILIIDLPYKSLLNPTTYIFVLLSFCLTVLLLTVSLIFSKNQIKSIIELTRAADHYGRNDNSYVYKPSGAKEIKRAGIAFLKMKDSINRNVEKRTQMLAMISHDLKTPLTRMRLQVELMDESDIKEEFLYDIRSMQHMLSSYLDFARGEGGESFKTIKIDKWVKNLIQSKWSGHNISLTVKNNPLKAKVKPHAFERAIENILSNALKYSTKIEISIYSDQENITIIFEDNGSGIKQKDKLLVFNPFYRVNKSRPLDNITSVGLGLTITKEIINGHFGSINLEDSKKLKGLLVRIKLPTQF